MFVFQGQITQDQSAASAPFSLLMRFCFGCAMVRRACLCCAFSTNISKYFNVFKFEHWIHSRLASCIRSMCSDYFISFYYTCCWLFKQVLFGLWLWISIYGMGDWYYSISYIDNIFGSTWYERISTDPYFFPIRLTLIESCDMSTGVIRLRADKRCKRSRACCSTAITNASCTALPSSPAAKDRDKKTA